MATALPILDIQEPGADLARKTVFIKLHLGLLGNSRKVSSSQVEVDADKALIRVSKNLLDSPELQAIRSLDGDIRRYLYDTCLPFDVGIHLLPLGLIEAVDERLREFKAQRDELVEVFLLAYPRLCQEAAVRLRTLYNPADYPPVDEVRACFTLSWQYISYGVPEQLGEISARIFETEREKAAEAMSQACDEIQQVMRASLAGNGQSPARPVGGPARRQAAASAGIDSAEASGFPYYLQPAQRGGRPGAEGAGGERHRRYWEASARMSCETCRWFVPLSGKAWPTSPLKWTYSLTIA